MGKIMICDVYQRAETKKFYKELNDTDKALFEFYQSFGYNFTVETKNPLTYQYYRILGFKLYFVRYDYKGRRFTRVYGKSLSDAKSRLPIYVQKSLFGIEQV